MRADCIGMVKELSGARKERNGALSQSDLLFVEHFGLAVMAVLCVVIVVVAK